MSADYFQIDKRATNIIAKFYRETSSTSDWMANPEQFISWLINRKEDGIISENTFQNYRRWMAVYADNLGNENVSFKLRQIGRKHRVKSNEKSEIKVDIHGNEINPDNQSKQSEKALYSALLDEPKIKNFGRALIQKKPLTENLRYDFGRQSLAAFRASMMLGLRPIEWKSATIKDSVICDHDGKQYNYVLETETAKIKRSQKSRTSTPFIRRLIISDFSEKEFQFIYSFIRGIPSSDIEYNKWRDQIRKTICRASINLKKENPAENYGELTWYSGRHIFASEVRRSGDTNANLAAMLGHQDTFNQSYYGDISGSRERKFGFSIAKSWPGESSKIMVELTNRSKKASKSPGDYA